MSRYPYEGFTRVAWAPTIADKAEPTVAELGTAVDLTCFITGDGLTPPSNQNMVASDALCETYDAETVGTFGGGFQLMMYRDNQVDGDDAWDLCVYKSTGFLVIRRGLAYATAFAAAQEVEVWPGQLHQPVAQQSARNTNQRFSEMIAVTSQPELRATVAAS